MIFRQIFQRFNYFRIEHMLKLIACYITIEGIFVNAGAIDIRNSFLQRFHIRIFGKQHDGVPKGKVVTGDMQ